MIRLPILVGCLLLHGALAAQTLPVEQRSVPARSAVGDSRKSDLDQDTMEFRHEWWQLTADLTDRDGLPWALEWTLYRQRPGSRDAGGALPAVGNSLAHVALTTPDGRYHEQRFAGRANHRADPAALSANINDDRDPGWEWVSQGAALLPARLSFSVGERDINLLLEAASDADEADAAMADPSGSRPLVRVRGFVNRGATKTYLRGFGRLDREWNSSVLVGKPPAAGGPVTRQISSSE